jgi:lysophospholipase
MAAGRVTIGRLITAAAIALVAAGAVVVTVLAIKRFSSEPFIESAPPPGLAEQFYPPQGWAWGELQVEGAPVQRYGVGAPDIVAKADVLILPDYGESAETWFETARDLEAAGATVWELDAVGQGGSGRLTSRRDLGEVRSFAPDVAATRAMIDLVIRPTPRRPLILLGQGVGALVAARAVETGAAPAALVLSAPACARATPAGALVLLGLGHLRAPGGAAWSRGGPDDLAAHRTHDAWRGAVTHAWQLANPDLRMGGPSLDWEAALGDLKGAALGDQADLKIPTLVLATDHTGDCLAPPGADRQTLAGADEALELEAAPQRDAWLAAVKQAIAAAIQRADPTPGAKP